MDSGTYPLLEGAYGMLNLTNVAVRGHNMHVDRSDIFPDTFEFVVSVNVTDGEAPSMVKVRDGFRFFQDCRF